MTTLDNLRLSAKRWLRALRAGDGEARARFERAYPQGPAAPGLRDVQHALARERGYESWNAMSASRGGRRTEDGARPDLRDFMGGRTHAERVATFLSFACWDHHVHGKGDHRMHDRAAGRLLAEHPELARDSIYTAIVCGDLEYVERAVAERPEAARARGGPRAWTPILYLAYTRFTHDATLENAMTIARLLLDAGADPNDFYQAGDAGYTVLTGAAGEGEQDAPRQPYAAELFDLLLARGAEPFDKQVLYNTHFSGDVLWWLELVYAHTIDTARGVAWKDPDWRMFDMDPYGSGARFLLQIALDKRDLRLAEWLLARGANPNAAPGRDRRLSKRSLYEDAVRAGLPDMAELLAKYGASVTELTLNDGEAFVYASFHLDRARAAALAAEHPEFLRSPDAMFAAAKADRPDVLALLVDVGVSVDVADETNTRPLHHAAVVNALRAAAFLVDRGAEIDAVETRYGSTPLGWAAHADHGAMLDYLSRYSRDIWRLCFRGYVDRARDVLDANPELARVTDDEGITPLWWLPDDEQKALAIVDLLIAHGADPSARSRRGTTAAEWALKRGMREVAAKLVAEAPIEPRLARTDLERAAYLAEDLTLAFDSGDPAALQRLSDHYRRAITWDDLKATVWKRVRTVREAKGRAGSFPVADAKNIVAREAGFASWDEFARAQQQGEAALARAPYVIDAKENRIRPRRALSADDWDAIVSVMKERGITSLGAGDQMTDAAMEQISRLEHVTSLRIGASQQLTDAGLRCLARMPQLEELDLSNYPGGAITDRGLEVLGELRGLRRFEMTWQRGISDAGVAHLAACERLEVVNLLGTQTGDGAVRALAGKPLLRRFTTGRQVTDAGVALLPEFPVFRTWRGGDPQYSLMSADAGPTHLVLDGPFTNRSLDALVTLDGLFGLSFFWHVSELTSDGLAPLASMSHLGFVGCQGTLCDDVAMRHIAAIPELRMLMGQGTVASDEGFITLSRSRTLEYVWGRECPNLTGRGFAAFANSPALRGLAVSCKRVEDEALATLPRFPALRELMPMDVSDEGFRHVGRCADLEGLWCMYCRDTTDNATTHLTGLARLRTYYAGATQITDRSLEILGGIASLERIELYECKGVTDRGLGYLAALPRLREISLEGLPQVTLAGTAVFPARVRVNYSI